MEQIVYPRIEQMQVYPKGQLVGSRSVPTLNREEQIFQNMENPTIIRHNANTVNRIDQSLSNRQSTDTGYPVPNSNNNLILLDKRYGVYEDSLLTQFRTSLDNIINQRPGKNLRRAENFRQAYGQDSRQPGGFVPQSEGNQMKYNDLSYTTYRITSNESNVK